MRLSLNSLVWFMLIFRSLVLIKLEYYSIVYIVIIYWITNLNRWMRNLIFFLINPNKMFSIQTLLVLGWRLLNPKRLDWVEKYVKPNPTWLMHTSYLWIVCNICWGLKNHEVAPRPKMAQRIKLHKKNILEPAIKKKDDMPKSIKVLRRNLNPWMGKL